MGITSSKQPQATLLAPSMEGNLNEVKRLMGIYLAADNGNNSKLATYINTEDAAGNTAVIGAVFSGHLDILSFLVESCRSNNGNDNDNIVDLTIKNRMGCSPLWIAAGYNQLECLDYIIHQLALSSQHESSSNQNQLEHALMDANGTGDTPFLAAVSKGNIKACQFLLESVDKYSHCCQGEDSTDSKCWELKRRILRTANNAGDTALKVAVATGQNEELVKLLLETDDSCADWYSNQSNSENDTTEEDDPLLQSKCIHRKNNSGLSPLIVACERNLPSIANLLLQHGANPCIQDSNGRNQLAVAAFCGCNDVVEYLLDKTDASSLLLNETDDRKCTPLWLAARTGNVSMMKLLVGAGADVAIANEEGLTPQDIAVKFKKEKAVEYFAQLSE